MLFFLLDISFSLVMLIRLDVDGGRSKLDDLMLIVFWIEDLIWKSDAVLLDQMRERDQGVIMEDMFKVCDAFTNPW